jgi:F-type H+-transporting ATPase subunit gamma
MANVKALRNRIRSIQSIAQITRAMEMVASMKLRKVQAKAIAHRDYALAVRGIATRLRSAIFEAGLQSLLPIRKQVKTSGIMLITSDRGLCGSFNANVIARAAQLDREIRAEHPGRKVKFFCYGRKGYAWLARRGYDIERWFVEPPVDRATFASAKVGAHAVAEAFRSGAVDEVLVCYTKYVSAARFEPTVDAYIPIVNPFQTDSAIESEPADYLIEPGAEALVPIYVRRYLEIAAWDTVLQSLVSEHASRRAAMKNATDAATRMGKELRRRYNRARQENITKELLDIVGGANAVS